MDGRFPGSFDPPDVGVLEQSLRLQWPLVKLKITVISPL